MSLTTRILSYTLRIFRGRCVRSTDFEPLPLGMCNSEGKLGYISRFLGTDPHAQDPQPAPLAVVVQLY